MTGRRDHHVAQCVLSPHLRPRYHHERADWAVIIASAWTTHGLPRGRASSLTQRCSGLPLEPQPGTGGNRFLARWDSTPPNGSSGHKNCLVQRSIHWRDAQRAMQRLNTHCSFLCLCFPLKHQFSTLLVTVDVFIACSAGAQTQGSVYKYALHRSGT